MRLLLVVATAVALCACPSSVAGSQKDDAGAPSVDGGGSASHDDAGTPPDVDSDPRVPPSCAVKVLSVNGEPFSGGDVYPGDDVKLSASDSTPTPPGSLIDIYQWSIIEMPAESVVVLTQPGEVVTGFASGADASVDAVGKYRVGVMVADDLGANASCELGFSVTAE